MATSNNNGDDDDVPPQPSSSPQPPAPPPPHHLERLPRVLSIQSHVASGRVGNRAALFPLALHRLDCDAINTVSFSNHTGYPRVSGSRLSAEGLEELLAGLDANGFLGSSRGRRGYDYVLTGYVGRAETLSAIKRAIERMVKSDDGNGNEKSRRPLVVVDPVMVPLSFFFFYLFFVSLCCLQRGEKELKLSFGEKNEKKKLITRKTFFKTFLKKKKLFKGRPRPSQGRLLFSFVFPLRA